MGGLLYHYYIIIVLPTLANWNGPSTSKHSSFDFPAEICPCCWAKNGEITDVLVSTPPIRLLVKINNESRSSPALRSIDHLGLLVRPRSRRQKKQKISSQTSRGYTAMFVNLRMVSLQYTTMVPWSVACISHCYPIVMVGPYRIVQLPWRPHRPIVVASQLGQQTIDTIPYHP